MQTTCDTVYQWDYLPNTNTHDSPIHNLSKKRVEIYFWSLKRRKKISPKQAFKCKIIFQIMHQTIWGECVSAKPSKAKLHRRVLLIWEYPRQPPANLRKKTPLKNWSNSPSRSSSWFVSLVGSRWSYRLLLISRHTSYLIKIFTN